MSKSKDTFDLTEDTVKGNRATAKDIQKARKLLVQSFLWSQSKEGSDYWDKVWRKLSRIAEYFDPDTEEL